MKKKISMVQMDCKFAMPEENYAHALDLMKQTLKDEPDVIVLPETINTGFFPADQLDELADEDGVKTKKIFSEFAKTNHVNVVAGSVTTKKSGKIFNTAYVFNRKGEVIAEYDKIHGFSPSGEHEFYEGGKNIVHFLIDDVKCSIIICYDIRFCELARSIALMDTDLLFIPAHWPLIRKRHWVTLATARAIENQMFVCAVNACSVAGETKFAGNSVLIDPWGEEICHLGEKEEIQVGEIDLDIIKGIRENINVFRDRKPQLYKL